MALRTLSALPTLADSLLSDRFNRIDRLFSQLTGDTPVAAAPSYDVKRRDASNYTISVSVPGWKENELEIETVGGTLKISGKRAEESSSEQESWIHRGIYREDFQLSFSLPEHTKVSHASLAEGLLKIDIHQEIPESEKPKKIAIGNSQNVLEHKS
jgi:molecular chaperone IbpA